MAVSEAVRLEREKRKTARDERLMSLLLEPQMMGMVTLLLGLYAAQRIPYSDDEGRNDILRGVATSGVVLAALSRAGLGGWQSLAAAGVAGASTVGAGSVGGVLPITFLDLYRQIKGGLS